MNVDRLLSNDWVQIMLKPLSVALPTGSLQPTASKMAIKGPRHGQILKMTPETPIRILRCNLWYDF